MNPFPFNANLRALSLAPILGTICFGILWGAGRLLRTSLGNVWWLRWQPNLVYSILLVLVLPWFLVVRWGVGGLQVYVVAGGFLAVILSFAGASARPR